MEYSKKDLDYAIKLFSKRHDKDLKRVLGRLKILYNNLDFYKIQISATPSKADIEKLTKHLIKIVKFVYMGTILAKEDVIKYCYLNGNCDHFIGAISAVYEKNLGIKIQPSTKFPTKGNNELYITRGALMYAMDVRYSKTATMEFEEGFANFDVTPSDTAESATVFEKTFLPNNIDIKFGKNPSLYEQLVAQYGENLDNEGLTVSFWASESPAMWATYVLLPLYNYYLDYYTAHPDDPNFETQGSSGTSGSYWRNPLSLLR